MSVLKYLFGQNAVNYTADKTAGVDVRLPKNGTLSRDISRFAAKTGLLSLLAGNDNQIPELILGEQMYDTSYFVGYNAKNEALFLFLDNAADVSKEGLMTHDQAKKAFSQSEGHRSHKASKFQTQADIDANQTDGGIRQFTAAEWRVIMNNMMGKDLDDQDPQKAVMLALWQKVRDAVEAQGEQYGWVNTASPNGPNYAVFQRVLYSSQNFTGRRGYGSNAVLSGRSTLRP